MASYAACLTALHRVKPSRVVSDFALPALGCFLLASFVSGPDARADEAESLLDVDYVMYSDPEFVAPGSRIEVTNRPLELWLRELKKPNPVLQRQLADSISLAGELSMPGIERAIVPLVELVSEKDLDPILRRSIVKSLVSLGATEHAKLLAELSEREGRAIQSIVEPALIRWKDDVLREVWRDRITTPSSADYYAMRLAIEGLGAIGDEASSSKLRDIVEANGASQPIRLAAASALSEIHDQGLVDFSQSLLASDPQSLGQRLLVVRLLRRHSDGDAMEVLFELAKGDQASVKSPALDRLYELDPQRVVEIGREAIKHSDVNVRRIAALAFFARPSAGSIEPLSWLLDDPNPDLRRSAADWLFQLAQGESLREEVIAQSTRVLGSDDWRGCEQATRVLVSLDHQPCGDRLVELLTHPRGEAMVAAGWGLRRLALEQHLPAMFNRSLEIFDGFRQVQYTTDDNGPEDLQAQLFLAFGQLKFRKAERLMRDYIPKDYSLGDDARAAACWSLGRFHEG
ncbi:MAG: hypothetical protein AAGJ83_03360, partial [Planctomycetota bacterium]